MKLLASAALVGACSARLVPATAASDSANGNGTKTFWDVYDSDSYRSMVDRNHHGLSNIRAVRRDTFGPGPGLGDCSVMPVGEAPLPDVDTPTAFVTNDDYHEFANEAQTPEGYDLVFRNHNATVESPSYLGLWTIFDYDPDVCAEVCYKQPTCKSFNLYISRDPSRDPGPRCPNPPAVANFNCALYSEPFNATMVTNLGQKRPPIDPNGNDFLVKLKASNGYVQNGEAYDHYYPLIGYDGPQTLPGAVNASDVDQGEGQFINTLGPYPDFKPYQCARTCDAVSEQRRAEATVECLKRPAEVKRCTFYPCQYFNIYTIVDQDGQKHTYCALFDAALSDDNATIIFTNDTAGNILPVGDNWAYVRNPKQVDVVPGPADEDAVPAVNRVNAEDLDGEFDSTSFCATTTITQISAVDGTITATVTVDHTTVLLSPYPVIATKTIIGYVKTRTTVIATAT